MGLPAAETNGSAERTEALFREHGAVVAAFCRSLLRDRAEAEDAAQQVFLSVHRALLNGAVPREPLAWLLAVARNECYARFRQRATAPLPTGAAPDGATSDASVHVMRAGEFARVWEEVERMPPAQREAFLLREIRGLSYGQLADELSLSGPSVRSLLLRARARLRKRLGDVTTALGGVPWVQPVFRLFADGDGTSAVPVATKAVAVGLGAAALAGGASVPRIVHHTSTAGKHGAAQHRPTARTRRVAATPSLATFTDTRRENRMAREDVGVGQTSRHRDGSGSGSGSSGSRDGGGDDTPAVAPVVQTTSDGHDGGGGSSSSGPGPSGSGSSGSGSSGSDGGSSSGPGSDTVTTTTLSSSGSGSSDSGSGSSGSGSTDGGGGSHDGGGSGSDDGSGGHGG